MADVGKLMKQMAKMQKKMASVEEALGEQELEVTSGGGAVKVTVTLQSAIKSIRLDPDFLKEDIALIEETLVEAVSSALKQAGEKHQAAMEAITAEFQVPGMR